MWKIGSRAGRHFKKNGDVFLARHVTSPNGDAMILCTIVGYRDIGLMREKVVVDRYLIDPIATISGMQNG